MVEKHRKLIYPQSRSRPLSDEVSGEYREDFAEANAILDLSEVAEPRLKLGDHPVLFEAEVEGHVLAFGAIAAVGGGEPGERRTRALEITDTESNPQPYLIDFGRRGSKWVTVAEPYGRAFAMNAIFLTDSVTGSTEVWRVPGNQSLNGNRRAIQTVRSVSIPGIVFSDDAVGTQDGSMPSPTARPGASRRFAGSSPRCRR